MSRVTLAQVAERAGVSAMTASYTYSRPARVSQRARDRVLAAAAELGYAGPDPSARSLRRGRTLTVGLVLGEHLTYAFEDPGAVSFLGGVAEVCARAGYGVTVLPVTGAVEDVARVTDAAVDGFIVWTTAEDDPVLDAVRATRRPAVVHGGPAREGLSVVSIDNVESARRIGGLAFADARRPAVVSQPLTRERVRTLDRGAALAPATFPVTRDRLAGYRAAAEQSGTGWEEVLVGVCSRNDVDEAEAMALELLDRSEPPDAVAASSDQQAVGVLRAARTLGRRVPDDLAVTGWDDLPVAGELGLTTVAQSLRDQGAVCARAALGGPVESVADAWSLVVRGSTRA